MNPFTILAAACGTAPLVIENALLGCRCAGHPQRLAQRRLHASFSLRRAFAIGPGACVWLALSELMPTRIRSNGMSIALTLNQAVSTTIAAVFLPTGGKYGYSTMFFIFAGCTVISLHHGRVFPAVETKAKDARGNRGGLREKVFLPKT